MKSQWQEARMWEMTEACEWSIGTAHAKWFKQVVIKAWIRYSKTVKDKTYLILNKNDKKKPWMIKKQKQNSFKNS